MRVLVTGATGFVGRHLLPALEAAGHQPLHPAFDITDPAATNGALEAARPDAVVHLAAIAAPTDAQNDPARAWQVNLHGTLGLAHATLRHAPRARFLFAGTADAYGLSFQPGTPLDESAPLAPQNTYGATKAAADLALGALAATDKLNLVRARPFNHTGPGQTPAFAVPAFAHQVARIAAGLQPPILHVGNLDAERDFLDVRDVCAAYALCLDADLPSGAILNVASGHPRRVGDILSDLLHLARITPEIRPDPTRMRPSDIPRACGNAQRLRTLGWTPAVPWPQTLADTLAHAQAHAGA